MPLRGRPRGRAGPARPGFCSQAGSSGPIRRASMWSSSSVRVLAETVDLFDRASSRRRTLASSPFVGLAQPQSRTITFSHVRLPQSPLQHICTNGARTGFGGLRYRTSGWPRQSRSLMKRLLSSRRGTALLRPSVNVGRREDRRGQVGGAVVTRRRSRNDVAVPVSHYRERLPPRSACTVKFRGEPEPIVLIDIRARHKHDLNESDRHRWLMA